MTTTEQSAIPTQMDNQETRQQLCSLYIRGSKTDAEALYFAWPGASDDGWINMERMLDPVSRFVANGEPYYVGLALRNMDSQSYGEDPLVPPADPPEWNQQQVPTEPAPAPAPTGTVPATELIARAQAATTTEELDEIESLANGRVTVLDAVDARREELAA